MRSEASAGPIGRPSFVVRAAVVGSRAMFITSKSADYVGFAALFQEGERRFSF